MIDLGIKDAFILAGGKGERLGELGKGKQKVMLPVAGKSIIEWNIELLARFGIKRVVLGAGHKSEQLQETIGNSIKFQHDGLQEVGIIYSEEEEPLGTAGALKNAEIHLGGTFFMMNGDELKDFDLGKMLEVHRKNKAMATLALVEVDDVSSFGVADLEGDKIKKFVEKPKQGEAPSNRINSGMYILEQEVFDLIPAGKNVNIEREVFTRIAEIGKLYGFSAQGAWYPTDTLERYERAQRRWKGFA